MADPITAIVGTLAEGAGIVDTLVEGAVKYGLEEQRYGHERETRTEEMRNRVLLMLAGTVFKCIDKAIDTVPILLRNSSANMLPLLTYTSAIAYFVTDRLPDPRIKKGVMLLQPNPRGYTFIQAFLDEDNKPVLRPDGTMYGRQLLIKKVDSELADLFNGKDYIIVE